MPAEDVSRLLAAAGGLNDTELAVALQGLLSRRPAAREVLLSVWRAEEAVARGGVAPLQQPLPAVAAPQVPQPQPPAAAAAAGPPSGFLAQACGFAARAGASKLTTEHVLAAAVNAFPEESSRSFGPVLHNQLGDLLKKSGLEPPKPGAPVSGGGNLRRDAESEKLFSVLQCAGPQALFAALQKLPNAAAATQLLEMARIFAQRAEPAPPPQQPAEAPMENGAPGPASGSACSRAKCFAAHNGAQTVGSEHVLACALELYPEAAEASLGEAVATQLVGLLEKSQLERPPPGAPDGEGMAIDEDAMELLEIAEPAALFQALQDMPDHAAAIQLLTMAKIFADRS